MRTVSGSGLPRLNLEPPRPFARPRRSGPRPRLRPLAWRFSSPVVAVAALLLADVLTVLAATWLVVQLRSLVSGAFLPQRGMLGAAGAWVAMRYYARLYPGIGLAAPEEFRRAIMTTVLAALVHVGTLFAVRDLDASRFIALGIWTALVPASWMARGLVKWVLQRLGFFGTPVVIVGAGEIARLVVEELRANRTIGLVPVGLFDEDPERVGTTVEGVPVLGSWLHAERYDFGYPVRNAIVAAPELGGAQLVELSRSLARRYPDLRVVPDLFGLGNLWVEVSSLGSCMTLALRHDRFRAGGLRLKRAFDLAVGVPLLVLALPLIALLALLVKLCSRGPAFYSQVREGLNGRLVRVWKIRTMAADAERRLESYLDENPDAREEWEGRMKLRDDPRVIPWLGTFMRRVSLDELPQLWNVLRGDLSLVGPRPFPNYHLERFSAEFRDLRRQVPPGITGYWQVTWRSDADLRVQEAADSYYVQNWSLWLDLWILVRTASVVLRGNGAY